MALSLIRKIMTAQVRPMEFMSMADTGHQTTVNCRGKQNCQTICWCFHPLKYLYWLKVNNKS